MAFATRFYDFETTSLLPSFCPSAIPNSRHRLVWVSLVWLEFGLFARFTMQCEISRACVCVCVCVCVLCARRMPFVWDVCVCVLLARSLNNVQQTKIGHFTNNASGFTSATALSEYVRTWPVSNTSARFLFARPRSSIAHWAISVHLWTVRRTIFVVRPSVCSWNAYIRIAGVCA